MTTQRPLTQGDIARWRTPSGVVIIGEVREVRTEPSMIDGWMTEPSVIVTVSPFEEWAFPLAETQLVQGDE